MASNLPGKKLLILFFIFMVQVGTLGWADNLSTEIDAVLSSAESLFKSMNSRDYPRIWQFLSKKSRNTIVDDVYKAEGGDSAGSSKEIIDKDFSGGAVLAKTYWDAYLKNFDPATVLQQSKWEMGLIKNNAAEIKITFKKAAAPAILQMLKEDGRWKVGLVETFGTKK